MDGARAVFLNAGFDGASMNDIARAAGVSKGTLYAYFDSKEQLFEALIREERESAGRAAVRFSARGRRPRRAVARIRTSFGRNDHARPDTVAQVRVVIAATAKFPQLGRAFYEAGPRYGVQKLAAQLDAFAKAGALEIADAELAARQFIDSVCPDCAQAAAFRRRRFRAAERDRRRRRRRGRGLSESLSPRRARSPRPRP